MLKMQALKKVKNDDMAFFLFNYFEHHVLKLFEDERLWEQCRDENNVIYWHNKATNESVREKPDNLMALLKDHQQEEQKEEKASRGKGRTRGGRRGRGR